MKELLEKLAGAFPIYAATLLALLRAPKTFVARQVTEDAPLEKALVFLASSAAIAFVLKMPLIDGDIWRELGAAAAFTGIVWFATGAVIWVAWRLVGGIGGFESTLVILLYYAGILELLLACSYLGFLGTLRAAAPSAYKELSASLSSGQAVSRAVESNGVLQSTGAQLSIAVGLLVIGAAVVWVFVGWGAYRSLHRRGRLASSLAFSVAGLALMPLYGLFLVIANALVS